MGIIRLLLPILLGFSIGYYHKILKETRDFLSYLSAMISLYVILKDLLK